MSDLDIYLIEITEHKDKGITYFPFVIWDCFDKGLNYYIDYIENSYGKIKAVWECDSNEDAVKWRKEILKMRGQEDLI